MNITTTAERQKNLKANKAKNDRLPYSRSYKIYGTGEVKVTNQLSQISSMNPSPFELYGIDHAFARIRAQDFDNRGHTNG